MDFKIKRINARQVLDSRGNPTIEAEIFTKDYSGLAMVPSGASTGMYEAKELRDNEKAYHGLSVLKAIKNTKDSGGAYEQQAKCIMKGTNIKLSTAKSIIDLLNIRRVPVESLKLSNEQPLQDEQYEAAEIRTRIKQIILQLDNREKLILKYRLYPEDESKIKKFREIGVKIGISGERVRQLEGKLIEKLQTLLREFN